MNIISMVMWSIICGLLTSLGFGVLCFVVLILWRHISMVNKCRSLILNREYDKVLKELEL